MKIAIGNDHGAVELKEIIVKHLTSLGHEVINFGTDSTESVDYPDVALPVALAVRDGQADKGILMCGTGIGVGLAANKVKGIRAAIVSDCFSAKMASAHNNANILCFGARVCGSELAKMLVDTYLETEFEGGRHQKRVDKIMKIEELD